MKNDNLITMGKLHKDIKTMKLVSCFLTPHMHQKLGTIEKEVDNVIQQTTLFNARFSDYGWCAYDSMSFSLIEAANTAYDTGGIEAAEKVLVQYYKTDVRDIIHYIKASSEAFLIRHDLIQKFFEDHFAERYYSSVPLGLIIIDGAVNDFTRIKGFFATGTEVDAWDCLVGCDDGLTKLKQRFNQTRKKTNQELITLPYRHGILHGRDLNYANEYVSCKCVSLMFAVADWMEMKCSEERRRAKFEKENNPPSIDESLAQILDNKQVKSEIANWKRRSIVIGQDIPATGTAENYSNYPYVISIIKMLDAWNEQNYGKLSNCLCNMLREKTASKRAGECRKLFERKKYRSFEIVEVEERACALSKVQLRVIWVTDDTIREGLLTFGCKYESTTEHLALPWRNNGEWVLIPWDVKELYCN